MNKQLARRIPNTCTWQPSSVSFVYWSSRRCDCHRCLTQGCPLWSHPLPLLCGSSFTLNTFFIILSISILVLFICRIPLTLLTHIIFYLFRPQTARSYLVSHNTLCLESSLDRVLFYCITVNVYHVVKVKNLLDFFENLLVNLESPRSHLFKLVTFQSLSFFFLSL